MLTTGGVVSTYSALAATVKNPQDTAGAGTIVMQETNSSGSTTSACTSSDGSSNAVTCSTFDKYGGASLQPGGSSSPTTIRIYNTGTIEATAFTLASGTCDLSSNPLGAAGNVCSSLLVSATCTRYSSGSSTGSTGIFADGATLTTIASTTVDLKAKGCSPSPGSAGGTTYTSIAFTVTLSSSAGTEVQGQSAKQQLVWTFTSGS